MTEAYAIPLPKSTASLVARTDVAERHPGLQLDRYLPSLEAPEGDSPAKRRQSSTAGGTEERTGFQEIQKRALAEVCKTRGEPGLLSALLNRRRRLLQALTAVVWSCKTTGPLTLHLARASALENAGICLHPVYGFLYLPGSALKGMARAFAETL